MLYPKREEMAKLTGIVVAAIVVAGGIFTAIDFGMGLLVSLF